MKIEKLLLIIASLLLAVMPSAFADDIYILFGQSNMAGADGYDNQDRVVDSRVKVLGFADTDGRTFNQWHDLRAPMHQTWTGVCPGNTFGRQMADNSPGTTIRLVPCSISGAWIDMFTKGFPRNDNDAFWLPPNNNWSGGYEWMLNRCNAAKSSGTIKGILFCQGESNNGQSDWPAKAAKVINDLKADLGLGDIPVLIGELYEGTYSSHNANQIPQMRNMIANAHIVSSAGLPQNGDNIHFSKQGYREYGYRYASKMQELVGASTGDPLLGVKKLINRSNNKALETSFQQRTAEWAFVDTYGYWGGENQQWEIIDVGNGYYRIMNVSNGGALEVGYDGRFDEGTTIDAYTYWGGDNQLWYIDDQNDGSYNIKSKGSDYYLGTNKFGWLDGVEQRAWEAADRQRWEISNP